MSKLRFKWFWLSIGFLLIGLVVTASLVKSPPDLVHFEMSDKVQHMAAYFVLTFWFGQIYWRNRTRWGIGLAFILLGVSMECLQGLSGYRSFEYGDMAANAMGVLCALFAAQTPLARGLATVERCILRLSRD